MSKKALLLICDGWGIGDRGKDDVIYNTPTPYWDELLKTYPNSQLQASGENVGLPDGQMGNSEVGHLNIGAGRIVYQDLVKINIACRQNTILDNPEIKRAYSYAKENGKQIHFMGLVSDGGVHSSLEHLFKLADIAKEYGIDNTFIHCFMDGRDTDPKSGKGFIEQLTAHCEQSAGKIASIVGRFYAMDRDKRWERVKEAYDLLVEGKGKQATDMVQAMQESYDEGVTDEFIKPTLCTGRDAASSPGAETAAGTKAAEPDIASAVSALTVQDGDSIIFCNFRPDRARELTRAFVDPDFDGFCRKKQVQDLTYVCMTQYDATIPHVEIAFPPQLITNTLGEYLSKRGLHQLRIAETEKYAHVTFFFNGGVEQANPLEDRVLIPSPKVATYDLQPEMSAPEVTAQVIKEVASSKYDVIILNFANADMVGHTGVFAAAVKAIETLDGCVQQIVDAVLAAGGQILLTADHGNADEMLDADGHVVTAHSTNPVPLVHISAEPATFIKDTGKLADIAPTLLHLMDLPVPPEMTGDCLVK